MSIARLRCLNGYACWRRGHSWLCLRERLDLWSWFLHFRNDGFSGHALAKIGLASSDVLFGFGPFLTVQGIALDQILAEASDGVLVAKVLLETSPLAKKM
jgi:hypothetical protein